MESASYQYNSTAKYACTHTHTSSGSGRGFSVRGTSPPKIPKRKNKRKIMKRTEKSRKGAKIIHRQ